MSHQSLFPSGIFKAIRSLKTKQTSLGIAQSNEAIRLQRDFKSIHTALIKVATSEKSFLYILRSFVRTAPNDVKTSSNIDDFVSVLVLDKQQHSRHHRIPATAFRLFSVLARSRLDPILIFFSSSKLNCEINKLMSASFRIFS